VPASDDSQAWKQSAAVAAVRAEVRQGMLVGLGTGSTIFFVLEELGRRVREDGLEIRGVPTSEATARLARERGISLVALDAPPDLAIDGADEVDPRRNLTKGGVGAMTREKCVAVAARRLVIVVDETKLVKRLAWPVPVEVLPFAEAFLTRRFRERFASSRPELRTRDGVVFVTDSGNHIVDLAFADARPPAHRLAAWLKACTGVVDHGLFVGLNPTVYVGGAEGVRVLG
jgi:ribose 5-phosphate isomerase A